MSKRILAFICMLALLVGLLPVGALAQTDSTPDTYMVGYAKMDMNPWVDLDEKDPDNLLPVNLTGNGNDSERACDGMMDDNGDSTIGEGDGLFTTCTAVTDANGTTVLYITLDTLQGDPSLVADIRNATMDALGANVVNGNQIIISGSHTHSGPYLLDAKKKYVRYKEENANGVFETKSKTYYQYICDQAAAAAVAAYNDRAPATMKRGSVDATTATAALNYNGGSGYQMNFLRHYQITAYYEKWGLLTGWVRDTKSYVVGSSFSTGGTTVGKAAALNGYEVTEAKHVAEADNTMHLLQFEFAEGSGKNPIVMVNWRAHPTTNSGVDKNKVSSDYVNSLRYQMEQKGYRSAFIQGAGANTVISSRYHTDWTAECPTPGTADTNVYGQLLAEVAEYCLNYSMTDDLSCGDIRIIQRTFKGNIQQDSEDLQAAVERITDEEGKIINTITFPHKDEINGCIINSRFHAEQIDRRKKEANNSDFTTQEIAVVSLGNSAVFVTAPNELSDRYGISSYSDTNNDWTNLVNNDTYGTPFVITHANGSNGYLPNSLNYDYNKGVTDRNGNPLPLSAGSYEANTSRYVQGTGEDLIAEYADILSLLNQNKNDTGIVTKECQECGPEVDWKPLSYLQYKDNYFGSGHYYLTEDIPGNARKTVRTGETLCLDLNGHSITTAGRTFIVHSGATLTIYDSEGTGTVTSTYSGANPTNGVLDIQGTANIYGGTFAFQNAEGQEYSGVGRGGIVGVSGTLHMYGGVIKGANLNSDKGFSSDNGVGGAVYVEGGQAHFHNNAQVISADKVQEGGFGLCVALSRNINSRVYLYDNASVEDIYFRSVVTGTGENKVETDKLYPNLTVSGAYKGTAGLSYDSAVAFSRGTEIGKVVDNADISEARFNLPVKLNGWYVNTNGDKLIVTGYHESTHAVIGEIEYDSLQAAVNAYTEGSVIKLVKNEANATTVSQNVSLDLNGCDVTGAVTVDDGYTLTCRDSATEDYDISDGVYGTIAKVEGDGNVEGMVVDSKPALDRHVKLVDENGISFHRLTLTMNISLRAVHNGVCAPSMYYKCNVKGDEMITAAIDYYGVALSTQAMPDATNLETKCKYSRLDDPLSAGAAGTGITSTLLYGIMKPTNSVQINNRNASIPVYGKAYIQIGEDYIFADKGYTRTLKQVTQATDVYWGSLSSSQKDSIIQMYNTYSPIMSGWTMDNFLEGMDPAGDNTLKVLVVGNSHGLDATRLLYEVFKDQEYNEQKVVLGALYKSGCTMKEHADFMTNGSPNYDYYENDGSNADGSWTVIEDTVADTALNAHQWDIVIMQQMSNYAATASTFNKTQFKTVINYVKNHQVHTPRFGWHMVWTHPDGNEYLYSNGSNSNLLNPDPEAWLNYHVKNFPSATDPNKYDQSVMYDKMVACAKEYIENDTTFLGSDVYDFVIPSATAVQYAHDVQGMAEAEVYRDYTHLSDYSRLMVAYLWYAKITGNTVSKVGISAIPSVLHHNNSTYPAVSTGLEITSDMQENILEAVNHALQYPYQLEK